MAILKPALVGQIAPDFKLESTDGWIELSMLRGQKVVLFFYPKDLTPGCTQEACAFNTHFQAFNLKSTPVLGISKDTLTSHKKFKEKYGFQYPLISDPQGEVCQAYGVWIEKSMYGKKYFGIERSTFVINEKGLITHEWRNVKIPGHAEDVLAVI